MMLHLNGFGKLAVLDQPALKHKSKIFADLHLAVGDVFHVNAIPACLMMSSGLLPVI
jgi:hypothetical protein